MGILAWILLGLIAGVLAGMVMRGGFGIIGDIVVGIVGALIGGFIFSALGSTGVTGFNIWSLFVAFVGACLLIAVLRAVSGSRARV